jgi:hypothetical protein
MSAVPSVVFPVVHAWKTESGVVAYADESRGLLLKSWKPWASDLPGNRQKYVTIGNLTFRLRWHTS